MKIFKYVALALVIGFVVILALDAAGYGPGYFSSVTIRKTLAVTGATTLSSTLGVTGATTLSNKVIVTSYVAGIDSFTTTATVDTLAISGVDTTDVFLVYGRGLPWQSGIDSVWYSVYTKQDTAFVTRASKTGTFKSGGAYQYIRFDK
jgi:hypothetical protein